MPDEVEALKKELARAKAEIADLQLKVNNLMFLLKKEMTSSGKMPKPPAPPKNDPTRN